MAEEAASTKVDELSSEIETDVVLIVKGAGQQTEDDHLNIFLRGFWPAIKSLDPTATMAQVIDGFDDYKPSPHNTGGNSHKHVVEIRAKHQFEEEVDKAKFLRQTNRRLWLKESYWESEVLPSGALSNLSKEWRMASFVFANMFRNVVFSRNTRALKEDRKNVNTEFQRWKTPGVRLWDYIGYYLSYFFLFLLVLLPFNQSLPTITGISGFWLVIITGLIWALAPTLEHSAGIYHWLEADRKGIFRSLPGLPGWVLLALIFLLISNPLSYLKLVGILFGLQVALIVARALLWNQRTYANSDVDISEYYSYYADGERTQKRIGKVDERWITRLPFTPLLYRYLIFLTLPIAFAGTLLASLFKWTRFLGGIGEAIDNFLNSMLVGYMDDVVNYAMDPAQSNRVRSAVMNDIVYFHGKPGVKRIHVVAHSQGTPITYETLFQFLDEKYQDKIITYATLGSVLSYYLQARGVLDTVYYERFPVPESKRQNFPKEFKWMNFWNFTDPITEFYGLDEYSGFELAPPIDETFDRRPTSPTNIRTWTSITQNHGEYWNNIERFTLPLAKRVLGELRPKEWGPDIERDKETKDTKQLDWKHYRHHIAVLLLWLSIVAGAFFLSRVGLIPWVVGAVNGFFSNLSFNADILTTYPDLNEMSIENLLRSLGTPLTDYFADMTANIRNNPLLAILWFFIIKVLTILIAFWVFWDWLNQIIRGIRIAMQP